MQLTKLQEDIIKAPYDKVVVLSAAASGKTTVLTEKVRQLLQANINPREIVVITFTNMAANELRERLGDDYKDGLFIGTIHSLANQMLIRAGIKTDKIIKEEKFNKLFPLIKKNPSCIWPIDWLLLDEAQDSDPDQFEFIFNMIKPPRFFIVGDYRQSIYQWNGAKPQLLLTLAKQKDIHTFSLNENHRNGSNILEYAKGILRRGYMTDDSIALREGGTVEACKFSKSNILKYIGLYGDYKDWAILAQRNDDVDDIAAMLTNAGVPVASFKQGDLTKAQLQSIMRSNTVKVLTVHSAKGLEWPYVMNCNIKYYNNEQYCVGYVAATRARDLLVLIR